MVLMKIICEVLLCYGLLVEDQASAAHEWMGWVLTKCDADQRLRKYKKVFVISILEINLKYNNCNMEEILISEGKCIYCNETFSQKEITKHLASHLAQMEKDAKLKLSKIYCHVEVEAGEMFLHLLVKGTAKMKVIDNFLRSIWLECCGHLSAFRHKDFKPSMSSLVEDIFAPKIKLQHDYDFGTTTTIALVARKHYKLLLKEDIILLSRNEPLKLLCAICKKNPASTLCSICRWDSYAFFCNECEKIHEDSCNDFEDYAKMDVVNSPRMGECGYDGGRIDKSRDGYFKIPE
jgi:hypothetical protein